MHIFSTRLSKVFNETFLNLINHSKLNSLTSLSHSLLVRHHEKCRVHHLHHQNQSHEKSYGTYPLGKSFSWRLILTMPSLKKQPWMRPLRWNTATKNDYFVTSEILITGIYKFLNNFSSPIMNLIRWITEQNVLLKYFKTNKCVETQQPKVSIFLHLKFLWLIYIYNFKWSLVSNNERHFSKTSKYITSIKWLAKDGW